MNEIFLLRTGAQVFAYLFQGGNCALCRLMRGRACQIGHSRKGTIAVIPLLLSRIELENVHALLVLNKDDNLIYGPRQVCV